jgi:peroxiredoxin
MIQSVDKAPNFTFYDTNIKEHSPYHFTMFSELKHYLSIDYDSFLEKFFFGMSDFSKRCKFEIDKDGILQNAEVLGSARAIPDFVKVKETLSTLS